MAGANFFVAFMILSSLVIHASANYDSSHTNTPKPELEKPKPEEKEKYEAPKLEGEVKIPITKPSYEQLNPEENEKFVPKKPEYEAPRPEEKVPKKPEYEAPKPEENEKSVPKKPEYEAPKPEEKDKFVPKKPVYEQPKPEEKEKLVPTKPVYFEQPKPEENTKPKYEEPKYPEEKEKKIPTNIGVQGLVLCKSGSKYFPLQGAVARITCVAVDKYGYKKNDVSVLSKACDAKGYFFASLSPSALGYEWDLKTCKIFLQYSPKPNCKVATNVNYGITGALLNNSYRFIKENNTKLYSVGPFFFTSESQTVSNGY